MTESHHDTLKKIHPSRIILPILIGIGVAFYVIFQENPSESLKQLTYSSALWLWLGIAVTLMLCRDIGYIIRLRLLANHKLTWKQCIRIVFLWEFASAVTPTAIGGTSVALLFLYKEKVSIGQGSTIVLATSFLDELFFAIMFPCMLFTVGSHQLFDSASTTATSLLQNRYVIFAIGGYAIKLLYIAVVSYGLFINPKSLKKFILFIFRFKFMEKWKDQATNAGDEIITASKALSHQKLSFWAKTICATAFSWISRYLVANALIIAVLNGLPNHSTASTLTFSEHLLLFAKQLVMWIMTMVMPTPGGSGFSEIIFLDFMHVAIPLGFVSIVALAWRFISYYPYLLIGGTILPTWIRRRFHRPHLKKTRKLLENKEV